MHKILLKTKILTFVVAATVFSTVFSQPAFAVCSPNEQAVSIDYGIEGTHESTDKDGHKIFCVPIDKSGDINKNPIIVVLKVAVRFLIAGVGLAVVGGIIFGGFTYMTARANAGQVEKGEDIIRNAIIGLILYVFMFALLNWLIPGGIFT